MYETMRAFANMKWIDALAMVLIVGGLGTVLPVRADDLEGQFRSPPNILLLFISSYQLT